MKKKSLFNLRLVLVLLQAMMLVLAISVNASFSENPQIPSGQELRSESKLYDVLDDRPSKNFQKADACTLLQQYVPHEPIMIAGDANFTALGFPGEGSSENPYIIEGLNITNAIQPLIYIKDTTVYFKIRNNLLNGSADKYGIYLHNALHGIVETNIVANCDTGIRLINSDYNSIFYNIVTNNKIGLVFRSGSDHNMVSHNMVSHNANYGIHIRVGQNNTLAHNTFINNDRYGIFLENQRTKQSILAHNTVSNNSHGISIQITGQHTIINNIASNNREAGIHLLMATNNIISNNTLSQNKYGIHGQSDVEHNTVSYNTISNNTRFGIILYWSGPNTLVGNNFVNNGLIISGRELKNYLQTKVTDNMVNGRPLVFWQQVNGGSIPPGAGQVILIDTTGVEITGQNIFQASIGMFAAFSSNLTIHHNIISHNLWGIYLENSQRTLIINNTLSQNTEGISFVQSGQNTLVRNNLVDNGLVISGREVDHYLQTNVTDNVVNGRPLVFWQQVSGGSVPPDAGQVLLINTSGVEVTGQNLSRASIGVLAAFSSNVTIHHNSISHCTTGIRLASASEHNIIYNNTLSHNSWGGIHLQGGDNTISNNTLSQNDWAGIYIEHYSRNIISNNTISQNTDHGIFLMMATANILSCNILSQNGRAGIYIDYSTQNSISNNTIFHNTEDGMYIGFGGQNNISHNMIFHNKGAGIHLEKSDNNILTYNTVINNTGYGMHLTVESLTFEPDWPEDNIVEWNNFLGNNLNGDSQASDSGKTNIFAYNYWNDHENTDQNGDEIADTPYSIAGSAHNQDASPRASIPPITIPTIIPPPTETTSPVSPETNTTTLISTIAFSEISHSTVVPVLLVASFLFGLRRQCYRAKTKNEDK